MPRRRFNRKRSFKRKRSFSRKRTTKRRRRPNAAVRNTTMIRAPTFMPDTLLTTLKVAESSVISLISGVQGEVAYVATGLFDTSQVSAIQPPGFFELMKIYNRYQVIGCSIQINIINPTVVPMSVSLIPIFQTSLPGMDATDFKSNPYAKGLYLTPAGGSKDTGMMKHYATTKAILGQNLNITSNLWGFSTTNPLTNWHWIIHISFPSTVSATVHFETRLKFYCRFARKLLIDPTMPGPLALVEPSVVP